MAEGCHGQPHAYSHICASSRCMMTIQCWISSIHVSSSSRNSTHWRLLYPQLWMRLPPENTPISDDLFIWIAEHIPRGHEWISKRGLKTPACFYALPSSHLLTSRCCRCCSWLSEYVTLLVVKQSRLLRRNVHIPPREYFCIASLAPFLV